MTGQVRSVVVKISAETAQAIRNVQAFGKAAGDAVDKVGDNRKAMQGLDQLGNTAGKVGLVAAAGLGVALAASTKFESAISSVEAATRETASGMNELRQAALDAGADTVFSATEAAQGIEELAKAGVATTDILAGGLTGALDLAAAGQLEVGEAAEFTATALNQFSLKGDQASHVADLLAAGAGKAQGEVRDMALALDYAGVPAAQLGVSIEETAGTIALLAKNGIIGEKAGTGLRGMLASLTSPSVKAAQTMDGLGISVFDTQGKFVGFEGVAGQLQSRLGGLTDAERANALGRIFGTEQLQAANILYREGADGVREMTAAVDDEGYAAENASIKLDNLSGDFERLKGSLETALIGTGSSSQGPLRSLTQGLTGVVDAYNKLPGAAKSATAGLLGVTALLGGGIFVASKTIQGINNTHTALSGLGVTASSVKGKVSSFSSFMGGPWGIALGGAAVALGLLMNEQAKAEGYVSSLTAALDDQTGAMTRQAIATNLQDEGWLEYAESIGVSAETVVDAALGSAEAMKEVNAAANADNSAWFAIWDSENWTKDADQFVANIQAQAEAQAQAEKNAKLLAEANGETGDSAGAAASAAGEAADGFEGMGAAAGQSLAQIEAAVKALQDARKAASETAQGFFNLGDSLNDSKVSLNDWIRDMEKQATALRNFRKNANEAADKGLRKGLIAALKEAGPEGALRMEQLANATKAEINRANAAWASGQHEINKYVDATTRVPKEKSTKLTIDSGGVYSSINAVEQALSSIKDEEVRINAVRVGAIYTASGGGGTVGRGKPKATGGPITGPGTGTSDEIPIWASNGEHMWTAREVANAGGHSRVEAMRSQFRYANGGPVGFFDAQTGSTGNADERLAVFQAEKQIKDLIKALNADGKNKLKGLDREIAKTELEAAKVALAAAKAGLGATARQKGEDAAQDAKDARDKAASDAKDQADAAEKRQQDQTDAMVAMIDGATTAVDGFIDAAEEQKSAAKEVRDAVVQNMERLGAAATAGFRSSLFESQSGNLYSGSSTSGVFGALSKDIAGLEARQGIITQLSAAGISSGAIDALLSEGSNRDIQGLLSSGRALEFDAMFKQREALLGSVSTQAGMAAYGGELGVANAGVGRIENQLVLLRQELQWLKSMRPISVTEAISAEATAREVARLQARAVV
ncbi:phage tail tape measure protein [Nocardioides sp. InS609-2]|uniref:phage tail tape measure protein n=1 Tax=Nocardioides sp. InS609-2 TaxID=2760705 RepID=UPI0020C0B2A9|nr:phage tail tape measure protein [Nocardioides sp. InS609-2]